MKKSQSRESQMLEATKKVIKDYLLEIRKEWSNNIESLVRIRQIELKILSVEGIIDIVNTKINNSTNNLTLSKYQIPIFGGVSQ